VCNGEPGESVGGGGWLKGHGETRSGFPHPPLLAGGARGGRRGGGPAAAAGMIAATTWVAPGGRPALSWSFLGAARTRQLFSWASCFAAKAFGGAAGRAPVWRSRGGTP
jgi:hypothetical protein